MKPDPVGVDRERLRLAALETLALPCDDLHTVFDRFVHLAAEVFQVPMAHFSFMNLDRVIHVAQTGLEPGTTPRDGTICTVVIAEDKTLVIPDASADPRWNTNAFVTGHPHIRFYAGTPVHVRGQPVGTFCLLDRRPRHTFDEDDRDLFESFASIVADLLDLHQLRRSVADGSARRMSSSIFKPAA